MPREPEARPFDRSQMAAISDFVARRTGGAMNAGWVTTVLGSVISDDGAVRDLWRGGARVAVGISVDGLETDGDAAELSLFCEPEDREALAALLDWGDARARAVGRRRLDIPCWPGTELALERLADRGYRLGHVIYEMRRPRDADPPPPPPTPLPDAWRWSPPSQDHARAYYETLRSAWAGLPGAFVAPFPSFCRLIESFDDPPQLLLTGDPAIPVAAFVRVERREDGAGHLAALGRHAAYRGFGLGDHLVVRGLTRLAELGTGDVVLEVVASNSAGLALYRRYEFAVIAEMPVYRLPL